MRKKIDPRRKRKKIVDRPLDKPGTKGLTLNHYIEALHKAGGIQTEAARALGVGRQQVSDMVARHEVLQKAIEEATETMLDEAEYNVHDAIKEGDLDVSKFFLDRKGKKRGYGRMNGIGNAGGITIHIGSEDEDVG